MVKQKFESFWLFRLNHLLMNTKAGDQGCLPRFPDLRASTWRAPVGSATMPDGLLPVLFLYVSRFFIIEPWHTGLELKTDLIAGVFPG